MPDWACRAFRVILMGSAEIPTAKVTEQELIEAIGAMIGVAKMSKALLTSPTRDLRDIEKIGPSFQISRDTLLRLTAPKFRAVEKRERKLDALALRPELQRALLEGKCAGASALLKSDGSLNDQSTIRETICFFVWLYWPQIKILGSLRELEQFFQDMRQDDVSRKNLEAVCREVGLRFRKRGRPRKT